MKINLNASTREEYFEKFLTIVSALAPQLQRLTDLEMVLLAKFMALPEQFAFYPFSPKAKKLINSSLPKPYSTQNLSIKICSLIDKKYLVRDEDNFVDFAPQLKKMIKSSSLDVTLQHNPSSKKDIGST